MRSYRFFPLSAATLLLALSIIAAGCGRPSDAERVKARHLQATYLERGVSAFERKQSLAQAKAASVQCDSQVGPLVTALDDLNGRLDVGLTFDQYDEKLGDVWVAYDKIVWGTLGSKSKCVLAGVHAENALNNYSDAYNIWKDCLGDMNCDLDSIDPSRQAKWTPASRQIQKMHEDFASVGQPVTRAKPTITLPKRTTQVRDSVYGRALADFCGDSAPVDAVKPCEDLKAVLTGGVSHGELEAFDDAVLGLNQAYHFAPAETG